MRMKDVELALVPLAAFVAKLRAQETHSEQSGARTVEVW